jgi:hypothetical protein
MSPEQIRRHFRREPDGTWVCVEGVVVPHPGGRIEIAAGTRFARGQRFMGVDVAVWIEQQLERG